MVGNLPENLNLDRDALAALLRWYVDMGVDCVVADAPIDRFVESAQSAALRASAAADADYAIEPAEFRQV